MGVLVNVRGGVKTGEWIPNFGSLAREGAAIRRIAQLHVLIHYKTSKKKKTHVNSLYTLEATQRLTLYAALYNYSDTLQTPLD